MHPAKSHNKLSPAILIFVLFIGAILASCLQGADSTILGGGGVNTATDTAEIASDDLGTDTADLGENTASNGIATVGGFSEPTTEAVPDGGVTTSDSGNSPVASIPLPSNDYLIISTPDANNEAIIQGVQNDVNQGTILVTFADASEIAQNKGKANASKKLARKDALYNSKQVLQTVTNAIKQSLFPLASAAEDQEDPCLMPYTACLTFNDDGSADPTPIAIPEGQDEDVVPQFRIAAMDPVTGETGEATLVSANDQVTYVGDLPMSRNAISETGNSKFLWITSPTGNVKQLSMTSSQRKRLYLNAGSFDDDYQLGALDGNQGAGQVTAFQHYIDNNTERFLFIKGDSVLENGLIENTRQTWFAQTRDYLYDLSMAAGWPTDINIIPGRNDTDEKFLSYAYRQGFDHLGFLGLSNNKPELQIINLSKATNKNNNNGSWAAKNNNSSDDNCILADTGEADVVNKGLIEHSVQAFGGESTLKTAYCSLYVFFKGTIDAVPMGMHKVAALFDAVLVPEEEYQEVIALTVAAGNAYEAAYQKEQKEGLVDYSEFITLLQETEKFVQTSRVYTTTGISLATKQESLDDVEREKALTESFCDQPDTQSYLDMMPTQRDQHGLAILTSETKVVEMLLARPQCYDARAKEVREGFLAVLLPHAVAFYSYHFSFSGDLAPVVAKVYEWSGLSSNAISMVINPNNNTLFMLDKGEDNQSAILRIFKLRFPTTSSELEQMKKTNRFAEKMPYLRGEINLNDHFFPGGKVQINPRDILLFHPKESDEKFLVITVEKLKSFLTIPLSGLAEQGLEEDVTVSATNR